MLKLTPVAKQILKEEENKQQIAAMDAAMGDSLRALASEFSANKDEMEQEVEKTDLKVNEALGALGIIGLLLALPKVTEILVKGVGKIVSVWKKIVKRGEAKGNEEEFAKNIIEFTHKWHKLYIKGIKGMLKLIGAFKKANIEGDAAQTKAAEAVYYTIIAALAVYSGVSAIGAFKGAIASAPHGGSFSLAAMEAAMAGVKSVEVAEFLTLLGLKA